MAHNSYVEKNIVVDERAKREITKFPRIVQIKFRALFRVLEIYGFIEEPFGKKLAGQSNLFEIRIKYQGQWRALYAYIGKKFIVILTGFKKKTQKTPFSEIQKAKNRLSEYKEAL